MISFQSSSVYYIYVLTYYLVLNNRVLLLGKYYYLELNWTGFWTGMEYIFSMALQLNAQHLALCMSRALVASVGVVTLTEHSLELLVVRMHVILYNAFL